MNTFDLAVPRARFATTRWSLVRRAQGGGNAGATRAALDELCRLYWGPVHGLIRRRRGAEQARDLTQEFFLRLLSRGFGAVDPMKGKLRSWLCGAVRHFLAYDAARMNAQCRDWQCELSFEDWHAGPGASSMAHGSTPERMFDRLWTFRLLDDALESLAEERRARGRGDLFERLRPFLSEARAGEPDYAGLAELLGTTTGAVKVEVCRLRSRFRELLLARVRRTVGSQEEVRSELRFLLDSLKDDE